MQHLKYCDKSKILVEYLTVKMDDELHQALYDLLSKDISLDVIDLLNLYFYRDETNKLYAFKIKQPEKKLVQVALRYDKKDGWYCHSTKNQIKKIEKKWFSLLNDFHFMCNNSFNDIVTEFNKDYKKYPQSKYLKEIKDFIDFNHFDPDEIGKVKLVDIGK